MTSTLDEVNHGTVANSFVFLVRIVTGCNGIDFVCCSVWKYGRLEVT